MSSSAIYAALTRSGENVSLVTVKRGLSEMSGAGIIDEFGSGRSTVYEIGIPGRLFADIDEKDYCAIETSQTIISPLHYNPKRVIIFVIYSKCYIPLFSGWE